MKLLAAILILSSSVAYSATDYTCVNRCSAQGYQWSFCNSKCTYNESYNYNQQTDYTCMNNCTIQGYMYNFCKSRCAY